MHSVFPGVFGVWCVGFVERTAYMQGRMPAATNFIAVPYSFFDELTEAGLIQLVGNGDRMGK